jgi:hypothetical protein
MMGLSMVHLGCLGCLRDAAADAPARLKEERSMA